MNKSDVSTYLNGRAEDFYALSDKIWELAEVKFEETQSSLETAGFLEKEGFRVTRGIAGMPTAIKGEWGSGKPVIAFLGEYDALPELSQKSGVAVKEPIVGNSSGHGCGHNLLGVGSLMGAVGLKAYLEQNGKPGTVLFFGCPAEEGGSGKTFMTRDGIFDGIDCAFCWHPSSVNLLPPGPMLANFTVRYSFTGKASHAAAAPEKGRSALDALELMNIGIQFLREHIPSSARIHYAITDAGGIAPNVVQAHASGLYQMRAPYAPMLTEIRERVDDIARGAALMTGTEVKIEFLKGTSNTVLLSALDGAMYENMKAISNPVKTAGDTDLAWALIKTQLPGDRMPAAPIDVTIKPYNAAGNMPLPGSSDTGDVSWVCPLSQCGVATWPVGTAEHSWQAVSCGKSDFAHKGMLYAGMILAATAVDAYEKPEIIAEAWKQLKEKTGGISYQCPIPSDMTPMYLKDALK